MHRAGSARACRERAGRPLHARKTPGFLVCGDDRKWSKRELCRWRKALIPPWGQHTAGRRQLERCTLPVAGSLSAAAHHQPSLQRWSIHPRRAPATMIRSRLCPQLLQLCLSAAWMDPHLLLSLRTPPRPRLRLNFRSARRLRKRGGSSRRACPTAGARGTGRAGASVAASAAPETSSQVRWTPAQQEQPIRPPARSHTLSRANLDALM